jgi:hypothetical protein
MAKKKATTKKTKKSPKPTTEPTLDIVVAAKSIGDDLGALSIPASIATLTKGAPIKDDAEYNEHARGLKTLKALLDAIAEQKKITIDPIYQGLQNLYRLQREAKAPIDKAVKAIKVRIGAYSLLQEEKAQKAAEKAAKKLEAAGKGEQAYDTRIAALETSHSPATEGVSVKKVWTFKIDNEDKVPDELWVIDEKKIGNLIKAHGEAAVGMWPGVTVYQKTQVAVKA